MKEESILDFEGKTPAQLQKLSTILAILLGNGRIPNYSIKYVKLLLLNPDIQVSQNYPVATLRMRAYNVFKKDGLKRRASHLY
ncbi:unnamed protein product [Gordionus sp. m RMFG-2023]